MDAKKIIDSVFKTVIEESKKDFPLGIIVKNALFADWDGKVLSIKIAGNEVLRFTFNFKDGEYQIVKTETITPGIDQFEKWVNEKYEEGATE